MKNDLINIKNIKLPKKINFVMPDFKDAFFRIKNHKELSHLSEEKWFERAKKGAKTTLSKIGIKNIKNIYTNINQCVPWKLVKLNDNLKINRLYMAIILKVDKKEYYVIDGNNSLGLLNHYKKNPPVWLIDESLETDDYKRIIKDKMNQISKIYDYGNITEMDKALVRDITNLLDKENLTNISNQLKLTFGLEKHDTYNIEESPFYNLCKENHIHMVKQGHTKLMENGKTTEYPIVSLCEDIRKFNNFIENILKKYGNLPK